MIFLLFTRPSVATAPTSSNSPVTSINNVYDLNALLPGPRSIYTERVIDIARKWPPQDLLSETDFPGSFYQIHGITTPNDEFYVGLRKCMLIEASLETLESLVDGYENYLTLFPEFKSIRVVSRERNKTEVYWERTVPVPFVPNTQYEMSYLSSKEKPNIRIYRYQLKVSNVLKSSDGIVVLERLKDKLSRFTAYDFYNAEWGIAKVLAPGRIWGDSIEGAYRSDVSLKLKAENPSLDKEQLLVASRKFIEKHRRPSVVFAEFKESLPKSAPKLAK